MAGVPMPSGRLQIQGERQSGQDVRTQNVTAVAAIANIVKSSLGPVGLDKVQPGCVPPPATCLLLRLASPPSNLSCC